MTPARKREGEAPRGAKAHAFSPATCVSQKIASEAVPERIPLDTVSAAKEILCVAEGLTHRFPDWLSACMSPEIGGDNVVTGVTNSSAEDEHFSDAKPDQANG